MTDIELLKSELEKINSYPPIFTKVQCEISGIGFFPGARGLWSDGDAKISDKPIMIIGHDFGAERDYKLSCERGHENLTALTWNNLVKMLSFYGIEKEECFFTNAIMGVRSEGSAIGKSPAFDYPEYLSDCKSFLIKQIEIQKPKLILVLGLHLLGFMATVSAELSAISKIKSYKKLDQERQSSFEGISFLDLEGFKTNVVFLTHPTYRHLNIDNRVFRDFKGAQAELELIKQFR
jgi:uracil-DNA glycosylase family 4